MNDAVRFDVLEVKLAVDSPIDINALSWTPRVYYTSATSGGVSANKARFLAGGFRLRWPLPTLDGEPLIAVKTAAASTTNTDNCQRMSDTH